jgi:Leucine-rich repeat (LRR) protein
MEELEYLGLSPVAPADIVLIRGLHKLKSLYLSSVEINDFSWMTELQELETLDLCNVKASEISGLPVLRSIRKIGIKGDSANNRDLVGEFSAEIPGRKKCHANRLWAQFGHSRGRVEKRFCG